jgi:hypothetical protein
METANIILNQYERSFGPFVHMSQEEKSIWLRFLQDGGTTFGPFTYDVRVGDGIELPAGASGYAIRSAAALTTKRIDVLFRHQGAFVIVEVKRRAGLSAVGQLIGYRDLFQRSPGLRDPVHMLLVTDELQPDMLPILESTGIRHVTVGP